MKTAATERGGFCSIEFVPYFTNVMTLCVIDAIYIVLTNIVTFKPIWVQYITRC